MDQDRQLYLTGLRKVHEAYQKIHDQLLEEDNYEPAGWVAADLMRVESEIKSLETEVENNPDKRK